MYTLSLLLLAVFSLFISLWAFVRWDASWLRNLNTIPVQALIILIVCVFLCAGLLLLYRLLQKQNEKKLQRFALLSILLLTLGQLAFLFLIQPQLRYDPLKTFDMAVEMLETHTISGTYETGYFSRYTNNYPITILTYWFLRLLSGFGLPKACFMPAVQLVNICCITGSIWLGYLILKDLRDPRRAVFYLLCCVLCPLSYVWAGYFYTATLSMPFLMGILYLYLRLSRSTSARSRIFLGGLLGTAVILGYKLRATAMIAFIAVLLTAALNFWITHRKLSASHILSGLKKYAGSAAALILTAVLSLGFWSSAVNHYVDFDYENTGFPMIHWVAMSARWDGSFDQMDELYTSSFETKEEKAEANKQVLLTRIREAGPAGLISLGGRKLLNTWVDGTDGYLAENSYCTFSKAYDYLLGNESGFLTIYAQAFRALQMLVIGFSALAALWMLWRRKERPGLFLIQLTLLGGMAFHLLWETNPLYSISFTFLSLMLLADGAASLAEQKAAAPVLQKSWLLCTVSFAALAVLLFLGKKELVETPIEKWNYCVDQYQYAGGYDGYVKSYDQSYVQTFTTDRPFNRFSVRVINPLDGYNQSAFTVKVTREDGTVIYENDRFLSGLVEKNKPYEFILENTVTPEGSSTYTLEISPGYIEDENSLEFLSYNTGNYDMYPGGSLTIAGEDQKNGDLAFAVYEYEITTYFSIKLYLLLCTGLLLLTGSLTFLLWRCRRNFHS